MILFVDCLFGSGTAFLHRPPQLWSLWLCGKSWNWVLLFVFALLFVWTNVWYLRTFLETRLWREKRGCTCTSLVWTVWHSALPWFVVMPRTCTAVLDTGQEWAFFTTLPEESESISIFSYVSCGSLWLPFIRLKKNLAFLTCWEFFSASLCWFLSNVLYLLRQLWFVFWYIFIFVWFSLTSDLLSDFGSHSYLLKISCQLDFLFIA